MYEIKESLHSELFISNIEWVFFWSFKTGVYVYIIAMHICDCKLIHIPVHVNPSP